MSVHRDEGGNIGEVLEAYIHYFNPKQTFCVPARESFAAWKAENRARLKALLGIDVPPPAPKAEILDSFTRENLVTELVAYETIPGVKVHANFIYPEGAKGLPGVVAMHDHSGYYDYGRQKIAAQAQESPELVQFKASAYSGRSWATELARRNFAVLVPDAFYFGDRRLDLASLPPQMDRFQTGADNLVRFEGYVVKQLISDFPSWPGILVYDDMRAVDYLVTREEADANRIGCGGLSVGGYRSALLAGMDERIRCAFVTGWMCRFEDLRLVNLRNHTYMLYIPGLLSHMDLPQIAAHVLPGHLFVQQCAQDALFPPDAMKGACDTLAELAAAAGVADHFRFRFYDCPHQFNAAMQDDAFAWLSQTL